MFWVLKRSTGSNVRLNVLCCGVTLLLWEQIHSPSLTGQLNVSVQQLLYNNPRMWQVCVLLAWDCSWLQREEGNKKKREGGVKGEGHGTSSHRSSAAMDAVSMATYIAHAIKCRHESMLRPLSSISTPPSILALHWHCTLPSYCLLPLCLFPDPQLCSSAQIFPR